jgi:hypothetical protein
MGDPQIALDHHPRFSNPCPWLCIALRATSKTDSSTALIALARIRSISVTRNISVAELYSLSCVIHPTRLPCGAGKICGGAQVYPAPCIQLAYDFQKKYLSHSWGQFTNSRHLHWPQRNGLQDDWMHRSSRCIPMLWFRSE